MSYFAYARKYRPQDFDEIIDQEHIATTLKNAIAQNNIAHAYIFSGPRGIGKTSTARILAKALNCKKGPTQKPCNKCIACEEINTGKSMDVLEIDGASNRGIDEIRTLRENVKFAPSASRFKIYIIDEVHMLTTEAFNALLKTLEEPPAHVKFIFATTEPHKVLPTILSRCQRFDFRKITAQGIINKLKTLITQEKISCSDEALYAIAKSADGSLRDAEVILDQMNSFSRGKITLEAVSSVLGLVSKQVVFKVVDKLNQEHIPENMSLLNKLIQEGKDPAQLTNAFIEHFRDMMMIKCKSIDLVTLAKEEKAKIKQQSENFAMENILYCIAVLVQTQERMKRQGMGRLLLEAALIKLSHQQELVPGKVLLERVHALEQTLKNLTADSFSVSMHKTKTIPKQTSNPVQAIDITPPKISPQSQSFAQEAAPEAPKAESTSAVATLKLKENTASEQSSLTLTAINNIWPQLIQKIRKNKMSLGLYLSEGRPLNIRGNIIEVGFLNECEFHRENLIEAQNLQIIERAASSLLDKEVKLDLIACNVLPEHAREEPQEEEVLYTALEESGEGSQDFNAFIQSAMDVFNGRIIQTDE